jgi:hypothetical protein
VKEKKTKCALKTGVKSHGWNKLLGIAKYKGKPKSIREMDEGVATEARKHK